MSLASSTEKGFRADASRKPPTQPGTARFLWSGIHSRRERSTAISWPDDLRSMRVGGGPPLCEPGEPGWSTARVAA